MDDPLQVQHWERFEVVLSKPSGSQKLGMVLKHVQIFGEERLKKGAYLAGLAEGPSMAKDLGLSPKDRLISVQGLDVLTMDFNRIVGMIRKATFPLTMVWQRKAGVATKLPGTAVERPLATPESSPPLPFPGVNSATAAAATPTKATTTIGSSSKGAIADSRLAAATGADAAGADAAGTRSAAGMEDWVQATSRGRAASRSARQLAEEGLRAASRGRFRASFEPSRSLSPGRQPQVNAGEQARQEAVPTGSAFGCSRGSTWSGGSGARAARTVVPRERQEDEQNEDILTDSNGDISGGGGGGGGGFAEGGSRLGVNRCRGVVEGSLGAEESRTKTERQGFFERPRRRERDKTRLDKLHAQDQGQASDQDQNAAAAATITRIPLTHRQEAVDGGTRTGRGGGDNRTGSGGSRNLLPQGASTSSRSGRRRRGAGAAAGRGEGRGGGGKGGRVRSKGGQTAAAPEEGGAVGVRAPAPDWLSTLMETEVVGFEGTRHARSRLKETVAREWAQQEYRSGMTKAQMGRGLTEKAFVRERLEGGTLFTLLAQDSSNYLVPGPFADADMELLGMSFAKAQANKELPLAASPNATVAAAAAAAAAGGEDAARGKAKRSSAKAAASVATGGGGGGGGASWENRLRNFQIDIPASAAYEGLTPDPEAVGRRSEGEGHAATVFGAELARQREGYHQHPSSWDGVGVEHATVLKHRRQFDFRCAAYEALNAARRSDKINALLQRTRRIHHDHASIIVTKRGALEGTLQNVRQQLRGREEQLQHVRMEQRGVNPLDAAVMAGLKESEAALMARVTEKRVQMAMIVEEANKVVRWEQTMEVARREAMQQAADMHGHGGGFVPGALHERNELVQAMISQKADIMLLSMFCKLRGPWLAPPGYVRLSRASEDSAAPQDNVRVSPNTAASSASGSIDGGTREADEEQDNANGEKTMSKVIRDGSSKSGNNSSSGSTNPMSAAIGSDRQTPGAVNGAEGTANPEKKTIKLKLLPPSEGGRSKEDTISPLDARGNGEEGGPAEDIEARAEADPPLADDDSSSEAMTGEEEVTARPPALAAANVGASGDRIDGDDPVPKDVSTPTVYDSGHVTGSGSAPGEGKAEGQTIDASFE